MIRVLDEQLINKIAAGEVIERPASIVKELVENALDAGADSIRVEVEGGGKKSIKVKDNGTGMSPQDAEICWHRHSTSKLHSIEDLFSIMSLGFRGEALASMASVAQLSIRTRRKDDMQGTEVLVKGGELISSEPAGTPVGTIIHITDIFYNTPARKKYMKSQRAEMRRITDVLTRYALVYPHVHFMLYHGKKEVINAPKSGPHENIGFMYGPQAKQLIEIKGSHKGIHVHGFISRPSLSKSSKSDQYFYVNGRSIRDKTIGDAVNDAYHTLMMTGKYPVVVLNLQMDPKDVDVNVHPQKAEVRLSDEQHVYETVHNVVLEHLRSSQFVPKASPKVQTQIQLSDAYSVEPRQKLLVKEKKSQEPDKLPSLRILDIINRTYILAETQGSLVLIDQHAAAERILFEKFQREFNEKNIKTQELIEPMHIDLSPRMVEKVLEDMQQYEDMGFTCEQFGPHTIALRTIPVLLGKQMGKDVFLQLVEKDKPLDRIFYRYLATKACRSAIKAGDHITLPQIKDYIRKLDKTEKSYNCPHGRPIMVSISFYEIEKMFKRIV